MMARGEDHQGQRAQNPAARASASLRHTSKPPGSCESSVYPRVRFSRQVARRGLSSGEAGGINASARAL